MDRYKFGDFIYNQRKKLGLTQDELGRKLGVTNKAVSKWETGETVPEITLLEPLAKILNVTVDELLTQKKPEMILIKPKKWPHFIWAIACLALMIIVLVLTIKITKKPEKEMLTLDNVSEYISINPCQKVQTDNLNIKIQGLINQIKEVDDINVKINFTIQYHYTNSNGGLSEVVYIDRYVIYTGENNSFTLELTPKYQISNFVSFEGLNINYEIEEVSGIIA